jgi:dTDP-L-rhamnose 4-epimerase
MRRATQELERLCLSMGRTHDIPTVVLRISDVYGPRQALGDPRTGAIASFALRLLNGRAPLVFEDGLQQRDLVSVHDVARACRMALESTTDPAGVFNVGSGSSTNIRTVAAQMAEALGRRELRPEITGTWRVGDVRHSLADTTLAAKVLGYEARVSFTEGFARARGVARPQADWTSVRCDLGSTRVTGARRYERRDGTRREPRAESLPPRAPGPVARARESATS